MNLDPPSPSKPLAGSCYHRWQTQQTQYAVAEICPVCKLYRYKASATADWEYRAPIPFARAAEPSGA